MNDNKSLHEFADAVKNALKSEGLWEHLQKQPGIRLPKNSHNFLRSVENIRVGRGPLNDFRLLKEILVFLHWPAERLFNVPPAALPSNESPASKKPEVQPRADLVDSIVERSLNRIENNLEIKAVRKLIPRQKSNTERKNVYRDITARTLLVLSLVRYSTVPMSFGMLYEGLTKKNPHKFGHLGPSFKIVDAILAKKVEHMEASSAKAANLTEWRLVVAYQMAAIHTALSPYWNLEYRDESISRLKINGSDMEREIFHKLHGFIEKIGTWLIEDEGSELELWSEAEKSLKVGAAILQNVTSAISSRIEEIPFTLAYGQKNKDNNVKVIMAADLYPTIVRRMGQCLKLEKEWLANFGYALYVLGHGTDSSRVPEVRGLYDALGEGFDADTAVGYLHADYLKSPWDLIKSDQPLEIMLRYFKDLGIKVYFENFTWPENDKEKEEISTHNVGNFISTTQKVKGNIHHKKPLKASKSLPKEDDEVVSPKVDSLYTKKSIEAIETSTPYDSTDPDDGDYYFPDELQTPYD